MLAQPHLHLKAYQAEARLVRANLVSTFEKLPVGLRKRALELLSDRTFRANGRPLLGEYAPWLIAEILQIKDVKSVREISFAWLHVYFFVLMVDDLIDRPSKKASVQDFIIGSVIYQRGLRALAQGLETEDPKAASVDSAFVDTALAGIRDLRFAERRTRSFALTPRMVEQKLAMLRLCARSLKTLSKGHTDLPTKVLDHFLARLGLGIQILDDLTDLEEDFGRANANYPLYLHAVRTSKHGHTYSEDVEFSDAVLLKLSRSGALAEALAAAKKAFDEAERDLTSARGASSTNAARYVNSLNVATTRAYRIVQQVQRQLIGLETKFRRSECTENALIGPKRRLVTKLKNALAVVAQQS